MVSAIAVRKKGMNFLLISLCVHAAAFVFMSSFVLHSIQEPRETVDVQLLKSVKHIQRRHRNILKPSIRTVARVNLPKKSQDIVRPKITQSDVSIYVATEVTPVSQHDYVELKQPKVFDKAANHGGLLAILPVQISKPATSNIIVQNPQERVLKICEQLSNLSSHHLPALPYSVKSADPSILRDFLRTIGKKIEKSKRYPRWAMDASIEGKVVIRFTILQDGRLCEEILVVNSSSTEILDSAAIAAVRNAAPFPALPKELRREQIQVELPMSFYLTRS